ncbi:MAG: TetR family transcriptional regulator [Rhodospirillales bacterium]|jgi:TetR/AcrR family transcriptional regulator|nr:TetR family transcriptional regulator [Rhodospirillales bacterium]
MRGTASATARRDGMSKTKAAESTQGSRASSSDDGGIIRQRNVARIIKAADAVFAEKGFSGATTGEIAERALLPKANLHYYFPTKRDLYTRVLENVLTVWLDALDEIRPDADPATALERYITRKIEYSRDFPDRSRLWAIEVIGGATHVRPFLRQRLRRHVEAKSVILEAWMEEGRMDTVDPAHLLFMLWATTQTYADFATQITAVLGKRRVDDATLATATTTATALFLKGLGLRR